MTATSLADFTIRDLEREVERNRAADWKAELRRRLQHRGLRTGNLGVGRDGAGLERLESNVGCHQLQRCREPLSIGILGVQDGAVIALEDEGGQDARRKRPKEPSRSLRRGSQGLRVS